MLNKNDIVFFTYFNRACHFFPALTQAQHIKVEKMRTETAVTYSVDDISGVDVLQREENVHCITNDEKQVGKQDCWLLLKRAANTANTKPGRLCE